MSVEFAVAQRKAAPPAPAVLEALARVTGSAPFKRSRRLSAFLKYVVETAVSGRGASIKAYTVGVEALGRPTSFNPSTDAIVRVEAGRLRTALDLYYGGEGSEDPVHIDLSVGSYAPVFGWRSSSASFINTQTERPQTPRQTQEWIDRCRQTHAEVVRTISDIQREVDALKASIAGSREVLAHSREVLQQLAGL